MESATCVSYSTGFCEDVFILARSLPPWREDPQWVVGGVSPTSRKCAEPRNARVVRC